MKKYKFLEDITTSDAAFEAYGSSYGELFENAGIALGELCTHLKHIIPKISKNIRIEKENIENLLFSFLEEIIFLKDTEMLVFSRINCNIQKKNGKWKLEAVLSGDKINPKIHKLGTDVKAPTKHLFKIEKLPNKTYRCRVILDI